MKIAFLSRENLFTNPGGDTVHMAETAKALEKLGCEVTILSSSTFVGKESSFDILHFFNLTRPADLLPHLGKIRCPIVVSPIYVDYSEVDSMVRSGFASWLRRLLGKNSFELIKVAARIIKGNEKNLSFRYFLKGYRGSILEILKHTRVILPNSYSEMNRFKADFPSCEIPFTVVPNGINLDFLKNVKKAEKENVIVCAARFERLKNQLSLIQATRDLNARLVLIGKPSPNQEDYFQMCKAKAHKNVEFISHLPQNELFDILSMAKVHALPSWFETTGLVSLEAAYLDCSIVVTRKGDQSEYFEGCAHFCDPDNLESIKAAINAALLDEPSKALKDKIETNLNWTNAANISLEVYKRQIQIARQN